MAPGKLREFALAAGATVEGERIVFTDEWQLEHCMSLAVQSTFETLGEMSREQRGRAYALLALWRESFGSRYERLGKEDHYAEGVTLHLAGVNRRLRRNDLSKAEREEVEAQVQRAAEGADLGA